MPDVVSGKAREHEPKQGDGDDDADAPDHAPPRRGFRDIAQCVDGRLSRHWDSDPVGGTRQRMRRHRIGHQHEVDEDYEFQGPARVIEGKPGKDQRVAERGGLGTCLHARIGVGHPQHAEAG